MFAPARRNAGLIPSLVRPTDLYRHSSILQAHASLVTGCSSHSFPSLNPSPILLHRYYSTPNTDPARREQRDSAPSPTPQAKEPKVVLRPGPIKPNSSATKKASSTPSSSKKDTNDASHLHPPPPPSPLHPHDVKEAVAQDLQEAYVHGVFKPPPPDASTLGKWWHTIVQYTKFYYNGVKMVATRAPQVREIRARLKGTAPGPPPTRAEVRMVALHEQDVRKMVPFIMIVIIAEELIPLVAIWAPWMLPSTCVLPIQRARIIEGKHRAAVEASARSGSTFAELRAAAKGDPPRVSLAALSTVPRLAQTDLCRILHTSGFFPRRNIEKQLRAVAADDALLIREILPTKRVGLTDEELADALADRGIPHEGLPRKQQEKLLLTWLEDVARFAEQPEEGLERRLYLVLGYKPLGA
ncbi:uncharacterized protein SCHCODRAFT_02635630 [Schizophyllum commune H4-8]|uniref:Letm1 RBD domain-containing protein n=1 Tax=Schizophyllum commune (strain H4-8 / FGSC 9210) TaxID=578458 RepID=D8QCZ3_SCHCM|nr:uncharacterized protein SCHCODRAFT_02635630 [Schizophyllum commune H4-8]KAI5889789.1 hypothetical protein SCHCODRAFT_02635630 [Schizophyllum commune H4-8]